MCWIESETLRLFSVTSRYIRVSLSRSSQRMMVVVWIVADTLENIVAT